MDSQTTTPGPLSAMLHSVTIDKAEKSEFNNSARDTIKLKVNNYNSTNAGENPVLESSDVIDFFRNVTQPFLAEVLKSDQSRVTVGEMTGNDSCDQVPQAVPTSRSSILELPVEIIDILPPEPSSLPVTNIADIYTRSMLKCLRGYPLYNPIPFCELSNEYPRNGINVGDVGFVRQTGTFDFLFNICPSQNGFINPPNLPDGFSLEAQDQSETTHSEPLPPNIHLFQSPITKTGSGEYICEGSEGAVLELPRGAVQSEAVNTCLFAKLAALYGVQWYEYTMNRGKDISNGSLYLITFVTKCSQWGIAIFDRPCALGQGLKFEKNRSFPFRKSTSEYRWKGSGAFHTKVSDHGQGDTPNQCVFVRGYKIMIRQDLFDNLCNNLPRRSDSEIPSSTPQAGCSSMTRERATGIRYGGLISRPTDASLLSRTTTRKSDEEVVLHPNFRSSLVHPSDFINAALMNQNPGAKVALTHDDVWCNLLQDNFPKLDYQALIDIARSYTNTADEYDCVSLEKFSNPSDVFEKSSYPLRGNEEPPTPHYDYTAVPATIFLNLPRELVERILLLLDTKSTLACRLVNRELNAIIQASTLVQYYLVRKAAGVIDNPQSPLSYAERLEAVKKREDAWRMLKPVFDMKIKLKNRLPTFSEMSAGVYFLNYKKGEDLYYCHLPSSPQDDPDWFRVPGHGPGKRWSGSIIEMGIAIYEHDLIVNVISSEVGNQADTQRHSLDLVLLKFSTREYHPLACHSLIHVQKSPSARPYTSVRTVGDNLALVVHDEDGSKLFIFNWKTGHKRLQHKSTHLGAAYDCSVPVFVSPELLLVPNCILFHFEVWHLFPSNPNTNPPIQILSLQIPAVSDDYSIISIYCHGEISPFLHSMPYFPPRPFFLSSETSIITVNLYLENLLGFRRSAYKLVVHRHALQDIIQKWISPSLLFEQQVEGPTLLMNKVTVHKVTDPDDGSVRLVAQSESVSMSDDSDPESPPQTSDSSTLTTSQTSATSHISGDSSFSFISSGSAPSTSRYNILQIQWGDWGPSISRWFQLNKTDMWWNNQSTGQRCVFLDPHPHDKRKSMVGVADFNPHNVRRNAKTMVRLRGREDEDNGGNGNDSKGKKEENEELEKLHHEGVFSEEVYMGLKCVVYHAPDEYDFDVVLMDEERLLGLKLDGDNQEESIEVLYFG